MRRFSGRYQRRSRRFQGMLSIVIPTFNEGRAPLDLVPGLAARDGVHEVLVIDASDDDESRACLDELDAPGVRVVQAEDRGRGAQMNQGARLASGEALLFLHCDTRLPANAVSHVRKALVTYQWGRFNLDLDAPDMRFRVIAGMIRLRSRLTRIATGDQAIFARRDFFLDQGGFAEIALMEDIEFSRRVGGVHRPALVTSPVVTSARRWIGHGTLRTILLMWKLRLLYRLGVSPERLATLYRSAR